MPDRQLGPKPARPLCTELGIGVVVADGDAGTPYGPGEEPETVPQEIKRQARARSGTLTQITVSSSGAATCWASPTCNGPARA